MKFTKYCLEKGERSERLKEYNRGGELVESTLYASMELS
jgi:hypothetical protein